MREEDKLRRTLEALESGLRVRDIASFQLKTCPPSRRVLTVLADPELLAFDQFPVRAKGAIVGVLERPVRRSDLPERASVGEAMRPLDDSLLVAADLPLPKFVPRAVDVPYHLVVSGNEIAGLVTRSDLLKLPVRLLAFAFVAHLEARMAALIRSRSQRDEWLGMLTPNRRRQVQRLAGKLARDRIDPDLLELTLFSDKRYVTCKLLNLESREVDELERIEHMRNRVAHGSDYARTDDDLRAFVATLRSAERWIAQLSGFTGARWAEDSA